MSKFKTNDYIEVIHTGLYDEQNKIKVGMRGQVVSQDGVKYLILLTDKRYWTVFENQLKLAKREEKEMNKIEKHDEICSKLNQLYEAKNQDYGDSFGKSYKEYGLTMACIRLEDKLNRLKSINFNKTVKVSDESLIDTLMDLANYSIMTIIELEGGKINE